MSEETEIKFTCSVCGIEFDPDPDSIVETGISPVFANDVESSEVQEEIQDTKEMLSSLERATPEELRAFGITPDQREAMLRGEEATGADCICIACQDRMLSEQDEE